MAKLKLGPVVEGKPVKVTVALPGSLHRDLAAYAEALARESGQAVADPANPGRFSASTTEICTRRAI